MKDLLEAGVHFGHQTQRWNPKMDKFIYGAKSGIHILDLRITYDAIEQAQEYVQKLVANSGKVLFVGTKPQAQHCLLYTSPSPRDSGQSRMPSSA